LFGDLKRAIAGIGELRRSFFLQNGEVKMTKQQLIALIENAGFEAVERDTVYNRVEQVGA
jgi:hypothetical protein